ncbi:hypothetical protein [Sphingobacterium corticibacter]|uniref:Uncharacterized protein n=1 Tax=Sphingobacterium corticibacter TaxID=2171749 RepID=A0A2T8HLN3_9SPHI|nr:hypothetical protein [Sphingobacterium corticibacter]PVH26290.1 hypothetical protein DC487_01295 [Sphingobacterium corticibacter]
MANQNTIKREVVVTTTQEQSRAVFNEWTLDFNVQRSDDHVQSISVSGYKDQSSVTASKNDQGYVNIGFSAGTRDSVLMIAILDEMDVISNISNNEKDK